MSEPEEVLTDVARHATIFVRDLWRRHSKPTDAATTTLSDVAARLDLLITAVFGEGYALRAAQPPAHATMLSILFRHDRKPRLSRPVPANNGVSVWLPPDLGIADPQEATARYRIMALQQVLRARRQGAGQPWQKLSPLESDVFLLLEAYAADQALAELLPGLVPELQALRAHCLLSRPPIAGFPRIRQPLEQMVRSLLAMPVGADHPRLPLTEGAEHSFGLVNQVIRDWRLLAEGDAVGHLGPRPLYRDWWTGDFLPPPDPKESLDSTATDENSPDELPPRSGRLPRRPEERKPTEEEKREESEDGIWMIQPEDSHPHAEDPMGLQRPVDRDDETSADEYGDLMSELSEARLVSTPGRPKEVLLSDDPPDARARQELKAAIEEGVGFCYPEWDYRSQTYREPGATVRLLSSSHGSQAWVDAILQEYQSVLQDIRRRFEMLSAHRVLSRRQVDGDDIDLEAYIESYADFRAGRPMAEGLYQSRRSAERNLAITLLIDISGSTDSWISASKRVIDVEREALLLVGSALEGLGEPWSVQAFSGEGPDAVTVRQVKDFGEPFSNDVALRISALEPQHYTRAGAALRHATVGLMQQPAAHRLLLLLSDGKPNDKDDYEGRYGVEDMRQAITKAGLQGIYPFCLTIDRQAVSYLPRIFGAHQYGLLAHPERLATVLLDWMKRLVTMTN